MSLCACSILNIKPIHVWFSYPVIFSLSLSVFRVIEHFLDLWINGVIITISSWEISGFRILLRHLIFFHNFFSSTGFCLGWNAITAQWQGLYKLFSACKEKNINNDKIKNTKICDKHYVRIDYITFQNVGCESRVKVS